jgi:MoxR-like ATPase
MASVGETMHPTSHGPNGMDGVDAEAMAEELSERFSTARDALSNYVFGQGTVVEQVLITLMSGGNGLLVGVPGLAKTRLVDSMGTVLGMNTKRIQFTPDLMPGDIVGSEVLEEAEDGRRSFRFIKGPVFCQLLMADEINRASPRTQSALLQAMQERHVTVAGHRYDLPKPFHVLATQNPLEQEGTYPLPEAQLDRFLMQIDVGYPDREAEQKMLLYTTVGDEQALQQVLTPDTLMRAQALVRRLPVGEKVVQTILGLVRSGRPDDSASETVRNFVAWGPSPRASQSFMLAIRARALLDGRFAPSIDDVIALAHPILRHRMALNFSARAEGATIKQVIDGLCQAYL